MIARRVWLSVMKLVNSQKLDGQRLTLDADSGLEGVHEHAGLSGHERELVT